MAKGWDKFIEDRWDEFFDELVDEIQEQSDMHCPKCNEYFVNLWINHKGLPEPCGHCRGKN